MAANVHTPEQAKRRGRLKVVGVLIVALAIFFGAALFRHNAAAPAPAPASPSPQTTADASFGRGMATAEFSAAFAKQLRDELDRRAGELKSANAKEFERLTSELTTQNATLRRELEDERLRAATAPKTKAPPAEAAVESMKIGGASGEAGAVGPAGSLVIDSARIGSDTSGGARDAGSPSARPPGPPRPVVPPNGFIRGRLLSGVVTTVGTAPTATLVRLEGQYKTANGFVVDLNGCLLATEASANLAAGRIEGKPARLTCNFENGRSQTWDVGGWLVDGADGIRGVRAVIVSNEEKKIALRGLAGALDTAGKVITQSQYTYQSSAFGTVGTLTGDAGKAVLGGAVSGAGDALGDELVNYYKLFAPSLQVGAQTPVTVVLTNPLDVPEEGSYVTDNYARGTTR